VDAPYIAVQLDSSCRQQQVDQGWFARLDDVPQRAISMSVRQILRSDCLLVIVTGRHKAQAVRGMVDGPIDPTCPASALQGHANCSVHLDAAAASGLRRVPAG